MAFLNRFASILLLCLKWHLGVEGRSVVSLEDHLKWREEIIKEENDKMFGENIILSVAEQNVNTILMQMKFKEYDAGFNDLKQFNPAHHFFLRKQYIEKSQVFEFIKDMPKGAALHIHDTALLGTEYLMKLTYKPNLYMCLKNDSLQLIFSKNTPKDDNCDWDLVENVRNKHENVQEFDENLAKRFTIEINDPSVVNRDNYETWSQLADVFILITPMLTYKPVWEEYFYDSLKEFRDDGVMYLEIRTTLPLLYDLEGNIYDEIECARSFKVAHDKFIKDYPDSYGLRIIFAPLRLVSNEVIHNYIEIMKELKSEFGDFVSGFDLVGQEDLGRPHIDFIKELVELPENIDVFYHAGETNWYGSTTDYNLVDVILLGAKRLGHAYALLKHPSVASLVLKNDVAIEVNPISNQVLGYVKDLRNHPAAMMFAENYPVTVSSDDPGLWGALPLSHDIYEAFLGIASKSSGLGFLKQLAINSIKYSAMPLKQKETAMEDFLDQWTDYIENFSQTFGEPNKTDSDCFSF